MTFSQTPFGIKIFRCKKKERKKFKIQFFLCFFKESPKVEKTLPKQQQSEHRPNVKNRDGERPKDLNEECVEKSVSLEHSPTQHKRSKAKSE